MSEPPCRLYLITPQKLDPAAFQASLAAALDAAVIAAVKADVRALAERFPLYPVR